jgi:hypothetical protein
MRLTVPEMRAILERRREEVRAARHSLPAMRRFLYRQLQQPDVVTDDAMMSAKFAAILSELPEETAEKLRLIDEFTAALHETIVMLSDWHASINEAGLTAGIGGGGGEEEE